MTAFYVGPSRTTDAKEERPRPVRGPAARPGHRGGQHRRFRAFPPDLCPHPRAGTLGLSTPGKGTLWFGRLDGKSYAEVDRSLCLPKLTPALVLQALEMRRRTSDMSENAWFEWVREWARTLPEPPARPEMG